MSFKLKLVVYFLLVSLLPLGAAGWGLHAVAARSETRRVDVRLEAGMRAVLAAYKDELSAAGRRANALAVDAAFQRALQQGDRRTLNRRLARARGVRLDTSSYSLGPARLIGSGTRVAVVSASASSVFGTLVAGVPLDSRSIASLRDRSGLEAKDNLVVLERGRIAAGPPALRGDRLSAPPRALTLPVGGERYRTLAAASRSGDSDEPSLALLAPQAQIDDSVAAADKRLLIGLAVSLALIGLVAYAVGGSIVASLARLVDAANAISSGRLDRRVEVQGKDEFAALGLAFNEMADQLEARLEELDAERGRLRDATVRFGEALAATHDVDQLLRVIVETVVETTGATGGLVVGLGGEIVQSGTLRTAARASSCR